MSLDEIKVEDCEGNVILGWNYKGLFLPQFILAEPIHERMAAISNLQGKEGDVLQVSFPKTGTNWVADMLTMLKNNKAELDMKEVFLEYATDFSSVLNQTEPRSFVTHLRVDKLPESLLKTAKTVLICRNPKDTAVSAMHHLKRDKLFQYQGDWNAFFGIASSGQLPYGSYFEYYRYWAETIRSHPEYKILLVYYEDFHLDSVGTLRKLCDFLEYDRTDELLEAITERCKFATNKAEKEAHPIGKILLEKMSIDGSFPIYRKGVIGDWKNYFTVAQSELFDKLQEKHLKDPMFKFVWDMPK